MKGLIMEFVNSIMLAVSVICLVYQIIEGRRMARNIRVRVYNAPTLSPDAKPDLYLVVPADQFTRAEVLGRISGALKGAKIQTDDVFTRVCDQVRQSWQTETDIALTW